MAAAERPFDHSDPAMIRTLLTTSSAFRAGPSALGVAVAASLLGACVRETPHEFV